MLAPQAEAIGQQLLALEQGLRSRAEDLALFLVYDRPARVKERSGLTRTYFAQRCVSDEQIDQTIDAFRSVGAYVELFAGERPLIEALAAGRLQSLGRTLNVVYNGIEGGIGIDGFVPGRKALLPCVADSYGMVCANSNAYACALGRHKFHYFTVLAAMGIPVPAVWHYRPGHGWAGGRAPDPGVKVIVKSTYESWSVGVTEDSVFVVDDSCEGRVAATAAEIGQAVTVQEFVSGREICVPVVAQPERLVTPPVEAILAKAPGDADAVMTIEDNLRNGGIAYEPFAGSPALMQQLRSDAVRAFETLELDAFARIDFRIDSGGSARVIDVGVSPGIGTGSSAFRSFSALGFDYPGFLRAVVAATLASRGLLL